MAVCLCNRKVNRGMEQQKKKDKRAVDEDPIKVLAKSRKHTWAADNASVFWFDAHTYDLACLQLVGPWCSGDPCKDLEGSLQTFTTSLLFLVAAGQAQKTDVSINSGYYQPQFFGVAGSSPMQPTLSYTFLAGQ